jgi:hypothetical protein
MTIEKPNPGAPGTTQQPSRREGRDRDAVNETKDDEQLSEDEKIKREQATNPTLMPIGDPAGAA